MRRLTLYSALIAALTLAGSWLRPTRVIIYAQSFPMIVHAEILPNPPSDGVTKYTYGLDTATPLDGTTALDATCNCIKSPSFTIQDANDHTIFLRAVNAWGTSTATPMPFKVKVPDPPKGQTIKAGPGQ